MARDADVDLMVLAVLDFHERDMIVHPSHVQPLTEEWVSRLKALVGDISVDLDQPIEGDVSL